MSCRRHSFAVLVALAISATLVQPVGAQADGPVRPDYGVVVAGFGSVTLTGQKDDKWNSAFGSELSPIMLFRMGDDFLVQTELEIGLGHEGTSLELGYAQIDFLRFENVLLSAGKMVLPFGTFGDRGHPSWINKLPGAPLIYGGAHGSSGGITPVLADIGVMTRYVGSLSPEWTINVAAYVVNGPGMAMEEDYEAMPATMPGEETDAGHVEVPELTFEASSADTNRDKMLGVRIGVVHSSNFEVYASAFRARYDEDNNLGLVGANFAADYRRGDFELRGEGTLLSQEFMHETSGMMERLNSPGYWVQASKKFGAWEPVLRWSHLLNAKSGGEILRDANHQLALGLDYWMAPSIPVKVAYEFNLRTPNRLLVQWAFGL